jgi:hypothetical protein
MKTFGVIAVIALVLAGIASAGLPSRLSKTQWAAYFKANTAFTKQTPKSVARFRYCTTSTTGSRDARAMQRCFGNTADLELTATKNLFAVLHRFEHRTATHCNTSLVNYEKALYFWQSVVTGLNRAVHSNVANIATIQSNASQARLVYPKVGQASAAFVVACKPKS